MKIQTIEIKKLKPAKYNPRRISHKAFGGLIASLKTFGLVEPIVVNKNMTIIGGHQRVKAWEALGNSDIPCYVVDLDEIQEKKLNVVLNSQAISGEYDQLLLEELLYELSTEQNYSELNMEELEEIDLSGKADYSPDYTPQFGESAVTSEAIKKEAERLAVQMIKENSVLSVVCPHCGEGFKVSQ